MFLDKNEIKQKYYQEIFNIENNNNISAFSSKKQIENLFLFNENYELGLLEHHTKNLRLMDENLLEKNVLNFGDAFLHEILYYHKNENHVFFIVLRSDNSIHFHDGIKTEVKLFMPLPEYQNYLIYNSKYFFNFHLNETLRVY